MDQPLDSQPILIPAIPGETAKSKTILVTLFVVVAALITGIGIYTALNYIGQNTEPSSKIPNYISQSSGTIPEIPTKTLKAEISMRSTNTDIIDHMRWKFTLTTDKDIEFVSTYKKGANNINDLSINTDEYTLVFEGAQFDMIPFATDDQRSASFINSNLADTEISRVTYKTPRADIAYTYVTNYKEGESTCYDYSANDEDKPKISCSDGGIPSKWLHIYCYPKTYIYASMCDEIVKEIHVTYEKGKDI